MRRHAPVQPHASLPRVFIPMPNEDLSAPRVPSTRERYDPIERHTRSRIRHTVDPPPPRVDKATDPGPIDRSNRSQTTSMANSTNLAQADKRRYPAQFLQSMEMIILDKTSGQLLEYRQLCKHPKFAHIWNISYANKLGQLYQGF